MLEPVLSVIEHEADAIHEMTAKERFAHDVSQKLRDLAKDIRDSNT